ncbi:hypothetical protein Q4566_02010 [Tamlana sp. 2_MG-2023]|uniref:hypothetical protein n=1 Tax=unclassified Tamlana TaxID=2614803 RepID=UPI0026E3DC3C|nr:MULTISPECIES: hypothetical protein [unclassified Tamlana]MDO6758960.1 hypothetical protein [Tamlana sp. 2_MG-2023]MDO6789659.1 hypothetical protein [Tamlana sp. 1_MG-2023]
MMLKSLTFFLIFITVLNLNAQDQKQIDTSTVKKAVFTVDKESTLTLDSTIKTYYKVVSAKKDTVRNWKQFKHLFKKDAKLIPSGKDKMGVYHVSYLSPDDYKKKSGDWFKANGFIQKEVHRKTEIFGNMAQVFSTFEAYHDLSDEEPFLRGINSFQLLYDEERWWIINIFWTHETYRHLIPKDYLPRKGRS